MSGRLLVAAILALALALRLGVALFDDPGPPVRDARDYARHAASIAEHGTYPQSAIAPDGGPTAFRPPVYPILLGVVFKAGDRDKAPRVVGAVIGAIAVGLLGLIALELFGEAVALVSTAIAAVFPPLIMVSVSMLAEGLFIALALAALACALAFRERPDRSAWVVAAGVLGGLAALTRTNGLVILVPLLLAVPRRRLVLLAAALVLIVPWAVRSSTALDTLVPTTTQAGFTLAGTYNQVSYGDPNFPAAWRPPTMPPYDKLRHSGGNEGELERKFRSEAFEFAADHPAYPLHVMFWTSARMFNVSDSEIEAISSREAGVGARFTKLNRWSIWLLAALAVAGAFTATARAAPRWLWLTPVLLWLSVAIAIGATRYRTPLDPFLILLAACAVVRWGPRWRPA